MKGRKGGRERKEKKRMEWKERKRGNLIVTQKKKNFISSKRNSRGINI